MWKPTEKKTVIHTLRDLSLKAHELSNLECNETIQLIRQLLKVICSDAWIDADQWIKKEMELVDIDDDAGKKLASSLEFTMGLLAKDFLDSTIKSLEFQKSQNKVTHPDLLKNVRDVHGSKVYGPLKISPLGAATFEVWTRPSMISYVNDSVSEDGVAIVLGAGNESFLSLIDTLHQIFIKRNTVLIKHHPLRPYLLEPYGIILKPLIDRGYLSQILDCGIPFTQEILRSPFVKHVHITGSLPVSKAIQKILATTRPEKTKKDIESMVTSELGCATPFIIAPFKYEEKELQNIATILVSSKRTNAGHNCLSAQVLILPKEWEQKDLFRKILVKEFQNQPSQPMYYPGSADKRESLLAHYKSDEKDVTRIEFINSTEFLGKGYKDCDQMALLNCGDPKEDGYIGEAIKTEAFGSVLSIVELSCKHDMRHDYLNEAIVPFLNDKSNIFGSLSCSLIVSPSSAKSESTQKAIASLQYGAIIVNESSPFGYCAMANGGVWGANPLDTTGHSGNGQIGNHFGIASVEKTVVYGGDLMTKTQIPMELPPPLLYNILRVVLQNQGKMDVIFRITKLLCSKVFGCFMPGSK